LPLAERKILTLHKPNQNAIQVFENWNKMEAKVEY